MNENTENSGNDFFYDLLDNPAGLSHSNAFNLQVLINSYPQSGLLRSMLAITRDEDGIRKASAYVSPKLLYKIATDVNSLAKVADEQIVFCGKPQSAINEPNTMGKVEVPNLALDETNYFHVPIDNDLVYFEEEETEAVIADDEQQESEALVEMEAVVAKAQYDEILPPPAEETEGAELADWQKDDGNDIVGDDAVQEELVHEEKLTAQGEQIEGSERENAAPHEEAATSGSAADTEAKLAREYDAYMSRADDANVLSDIGEKPIHPHQEIDDDVFEEIVSIEDIGLEQLAIIGKVAEEHEGQNEPGAQVEVKPENSYEVFEPTLPEDEELTSNKTAQHLTEKKAGERVARYNDEKMPYSFMWWLDKTRKEHAATYQPFVEGKIKAPATTATEVKPQPPADHLQQQYLENIFTVTAVVSDLNLTPPKVEAPLPFDSKVDKIIERFIQEEPQIKHPAKAKLDNENKAKKSSEDKDELVTETLAKIYTEQMLYHKAILTYKKLMLKFPEKSLYFAGQIEQLEKKIN